MSRQDIIEYLGEDWDRVLALIRDRLHSDVQLLEDTNSRLLSNAGKLLRPMIALLIARAIGQPNEDSIRCAAAAELLHNATLIHDDVADGSAEHRDQMVRAFAKTLTDLAEGEMLQLEKASSCDTREEDYLRIIHCKTASLFLASAEAAALSVDADPARLEAACAYGAALGIAFQIKDDILDYAGSEALGKPVGVDLKEQKITLPLLAALDGSPREAEIRALVRDIPSHPEHCGEIRRFVAERGGVEKAADRLAEWVERAVRALDVFPDGPARRFLTAIARFNNFRQV